MAGLRDEMRASDADRQAVGERLRAALDEGRLDFHEYDTRLRDAYAAKTYGELRRLIDDLPKLTVAPPAASQLVPQQPGSPAAERVPAGPPAPEVVRQWLSEVWGTWAKVVAINVAIWAVVGFAADVWAFWPIWVAGPWGVVLLVHTITGLRRGEPQRWAERKERKRARRELKRVAQIERRLRG